MLGVRNGFRGFVDGDIQEMEWMSVNGWASRGRRRARHQPQASPADGTSTPSPATSRPRGIDAILMIGGWSGYQAIHKLCSERERFPAFDIPMVCLPASINNNLPGSEISHRQRHRPEHHRRGGGQDQAVGGRLASAASWWRSWAATAATSPSSSGLATGAERVYLHEEGVTLADLQRDLARLVEGFRQGKRLGLVVRDEEANPLYTTPFMYALFEEEGGDLFDVRQAILGHLQQGGDPSPFDRILATRFAAECVDVPGPARRSPRPQTPLFIGVREGKVTVTPIDDLPRLMDMKNERPRDQWWRALAPIARLLAQPGPSAG